MNLVARTNYGGPLLNIMHKLYSRGLKQFFLEQCEFNSIVTAEKIRAKNEVLVCAKQLLIVKTILFEVRKLHIYLTGKRSILILSHEPWSVSFS